MRLSQFSSTSVQHPVCQGGTLSQQFGIQCSICAFLNSQVRDPVCQGMILQEITKTILLGKMKYGEFNVVLQCMYISSTLLQFLAASILGAKNLTYNFFYFIAKVKLAPVATLSIDGICSHADVPASFPQRKNKHPCQFIPSRQASCQHPWVLLLLEWNILLCFCIVI